jgi:hypothetical protein
MQTDTDAQPGISAVASTSVDVITPVGAKKTGDMITGVFFPGKEDGIVKIMHTGSEFSSSFDLRSITKEQEIPAVQILGSESVYAITYTLGPLISNKNAEKETMNVDSILILPISDQDTGKNASERFTIGARLRIGPSQAPGHYSSESPCTIIIHFN